MKISYQVKKISKCIKNGHTEPVGNVQHVGHDINHAFVVCASYNDGVYKGCGCSSEVKEIIEE